MNAKPNHQTKFIDLGLIDYQKAWDYQTELFNQILAIKSSNRSPIGEDQQPTNNYLIFCEHPHVFTLGRNGEENNLLIKKESLDSIHATYYHINRGGDITYHGPGQLVVYPVIDLENFFTDIHQYMRLLEESVIKTLEEFKIDAGRIPGLTGVWCGVEEPSSARKICALGVKTSRWVTMHGLAFNISPDLNYFKHIIACGIQDRAVTSLEKELNHQPNAQQVATILKEKIGTLFGMNYVN